MFNDDTEYTVTLDDGASIQSFAWDADHARDKVEWAIEQSGQDRVIVSVEPV